MRRILLFTLLLFIGKAYSAEYVIRLNDTEKYAITEIISAIGEKNLARLLMDSSRLTALGNSIEHVPPLQLLAFVLVDPYLKRCLKQASTTYFQWNAFVDGFGENMNKEYAAGRLFNDLPGFAELVDGKLSELVTLSHEHNWEEFVLCLL